MRKLVVVALLGSLAQLVDGTLGMAYGVTATTALLVAGITPAVASASVHLSEVGTTLASGISHWRFGNVDWRVVGLIGVPGGVGAFTGATVLSGLSTESASRWVAALLIGLGLYILARFATGRVRAVVTGRPAGRLLGPLGLVAGFIDATGGGGWGPVATSTLLGSGRLEPRKTVGSVNTAEFIVAVAASAGFLVGLGRQNVPVDLVLALLAGGVLAAPVAAYLVSRVPVRWLGVGVGGLLVLTNARTLLTASGIGTGGRFAAYVAIVALWLAAAVVGARLLRQQRAAVAPVESRELEVVGS
ncbi:MAG TPA: sulfite exporter TauE/SafE family protein [Kribbellaceae bacterium]|nr:sulfite exporter TauE/SafE family protein [Kribbellaceae bacterium]